MPKFPEGPVWPMPWAWTSALLWNPVSSYSCPWVHEAWDFSLGAFFSHLGGMQALHDSVVTSRGTVSLSQSPWTQSQVQAELGFGAANPG